MEIILFSGLWFSTFLLKKYFEDHLTLFKKILLFAPCAYNVQNVEQLRNVKLRKEYPQGCLNCEFIAKFVYHSFSVLNMAILAPSNNNIILNVWMLLPGAEIALLTPINTLCN